MIGWPSRPGDGRAVRRRSSWAAEYYGEAADFVHAHADQYGPRMQVYLRRRATDNWCANANILRWW
jgi:hypothetical protein